MSKVILIISGRNGIGRALADSLYNRKDYKIYATSRSPKESSSPYPFLYLDVFDQSSIDNVISEIIYKEKRIDVLLNIPNMFAIDASEEFSIEQIDKLININLLGVLRINNAILPHMRKSGRGHIIHLNSISGHIPTPFMSTYSASKAALKAYLYSIFYELRHLNINVSLINPSAFMHRALSNNSQNADKYIPDYADIKKRAKHNIIGMFNNGLAYKEIISTAIKIINKPNKNKFLYPVGRFCLLEKLRLYLEQKAINNFYRKISRS